MKLSSNPLFDTLSESESILIAGAGGGFDIYSGLPLYFALRALGKDVHLANLSFAFLPRDPENRITKSCLRVTADSSGSESYFPEKTLCNWFRNARNEEVSIFCFPQCGVIPMSEAYRALKKLLNLDAVVLVDGGTDSLMKGDEPSLGTPEEDIASIVAVHQLDVKTKLLSCLGFGIDLFHGVCHAHFLESVAALTRAQAFLGTFSVLPQMDEAQDYLRAVAYATEHTSGRPSIVSTSIASAVEGHYGNHHTTSRTAGSELWINPLMPIYWNFFVDAVYERNLYANSLLETQTLAEISTRISMYRARCDIRPWVEIPV